MKKKIHKILICSLMFVLFTSLVGCKNLNIKEEISHTYDSMLHVYPSTNPNYSILNEEEKEILDIVVRKFKNYKAADIVAYIESTDEPQLNLLDITPIMSAESYKLR